MAPGSDPESASSFLRGLRLGGLVILFVARGGPRRGIGGGPIHHARLNKRERLAGRSVPSFATPYSWFDLTPRFRSVPSDVGVRAADATPGAAAPCAAALVIETDFVSKIGPTLAVCENPMRERKDAASPGHVIAFISGPARRVPCNGSPCLFSVENIQRQLELKWATVGLAWLLASANAMAQEPPAPAPTLAQAPAQEPFAQPAPMPRAFVPQPTTPPAAAPAQKLTREEQLEERVRQLEAIVKQLQFQQAQASSGSSGSGSSTSGSWSDPSKPGPGSTPPLTASAWNDSHTPLPVPVQSIPSNPAISPLFDLPATMPRQPAVASFGPGFEIMTEDEEFVLQFHDLTQCVISARKSRCRASTSRRVTCSLARPGAASASSSRAGHSACVLDSLDWAWEVYGRYNFMDVGNQIYTGGIADPTGNANRLWMTDTGLTWHMTQYIKMFFDWNHVEFNDRVYYNAGKHQAAGTQDLLWWRLQLYF